MAVLNKHRDYIPPNAVFIGRGSKWGNEFSHLPNTTAKFKVKDRTEAIEQHELKLQNDLNNGYVTEEELAALHGKDLVCFCAPLSCHGHTLERYAKLCYEALYPSTGDSNDEAIY